MKVTDISIIEYLNSRGIEIRKEGDYHVCSSPFSSDSEWSFIVYPTNTFYDWSSGFGGNIINLHARLEHMSIKDAHADLRTNKNYSISIKPNEKKHYKKQFKIEDYLNENPEEIALIHKYAQARGIKQGYEPGVFFIGSRSGDSALTRVPALLFRHVDKELKLCGIKLRQAGQGEPRFRAKGKLGFYILETQESGLWDLETILYIVEGEANANSLWDYFKSIHKPAVVLSVGGVAKKLAKNDLPVKYQGLPIKLIIDYDGNEEKYQERLKFYSDLGAQPIKIIMPKGEDLNSLYAKDQMYLVENLIL